MKINEDEALQAVTKIDEAATQSGKDLAYTSGLVLIISIIAVAGVAVVIARQLVRPLIDTVSLLKDIAQGEGDLTRRIVVKTKDEIGELGTWFNTFVEKLHGIIADVVGNASKLAGASVELAASSIEMSGHSEEIGKQASGVSAASEEMTTTMEGMAASGEQMAANVKTIAAAVEEMTASITEVARNAEQAATVADKGVRFGRDQQ